MYHDRHSEDLDLHRPMNQAERVIGRFERWLRAQGFDAQPDPFVPPSIDDFGCEKASDLVKHYLLARPYEAGFHELLMNHAHRLGHLIPIWGDGCGGVFLAN